MVQVHANCSSSLLKMSSSSSNSSLKTIKNLKFVNTVLKSLPVDKSMRYEPRTVSGVCFCLTNPTPVENPRLVAVSWCAMKLLDIDEGTIESSKEMAEYFSGNKTLMGSEPAAHCYCGHQFGTFSGQLGDGASMYLGEVLNQAGRRWEIQLKGAGRTPFSRIGDGRKVLRSCIREFLCSEAMYHLGVPTTRAGTLITSDSIIMRDPLNNGRVIPENCSLVLRIAPTFLRFGSFEIVKQEDPMMNIAGPSAGREDILKKLINFCISSYFPHIEEKPYTEEQKYLKFYEEVCIRTAHMVASWQCFGFCHGVLNTDNMSILGLTIDYGPFAFLDRYIPDYISNTADDSARYSYRRQPEMCCWNLRKLIDALKLCVPPEKSLDVLEKKFYPSYHSFYFSKMRRKLGLISKEFHEDEKLILEFLQTMEETCADFTKAFRCLNLISLPGTSDHKVSSQKLLDALIKNSASLEVAKAIFRSTSTVEDLLPLKSLAIQNPHGPIKKELEKAEKMESINKFTAKSLESFHKEKWTAWLNHYKKRLAKECVSCSDIEALNTERKKVMNITNPKYVLRSYIAQNAISQAQKGNFLEVQNVLRRLQNPYSEDESDTKGPHFGFNNVMYDAVPPPSKLDLLLS